MENEEKHKKGKIRYMILSVIIAVIVWVLIAYSNNPDISKTFHNVEVTFSGETSLRENGYTILNKNDIPTLSVKVSGKRSDLISIMDRIDLVIDVSQITEAGEYELSGTIDMPNDRVSIVKEKFNTVPVSIGKMITAEVPVQVRQVGECTGKLVRSIAETQSVKISGSEVEIKEIASAVATVNLNEITETCETMRDVKFMDHEGKEMPIHATIVTNTKQIGIMNTVYEIKTLPVTARLSSELDIAYILDSIKTQINPNQLTVGVLPNSNVTNLTATINQLTDGEMTISIDETAGIFVPDSSKKVKIIPSVTNKQ